MPLAEYSWNSVLQYPQVNNGLLALYDVYYEEFLEIFLEKHVFFVVFMV